MPDPQSPVGDVTSRAATPTGHPLLDGAASWRDWYPVAVAAALTLVLVSGLLLVFGQVSDHDRPAVFNSLVTTVYWLGASLIGACSTIVVLMLTTLGLLEHLETDRLTARFLFHLRLIVIAAMTTIAFAVLALILTVFPSSEAADVRPDSGLLTAIYWILLVVTALMTGGFATVLGGLYVTIGDIFRTLPETWVADIMAEIPDETDAARGDQSPS